MTASAIYAVLEETRRTGSKEMRLVSAQEIVVEPAVRGKAGPLGDSGLIFNTGNQSVGKYLGR
jgi:hypothetical protein